MHLRGSLLLYLTPFHIACLDVWVLTNKYSCTDCATMQMPVMGGGRAYDNAVTLV
jgi:hypothetical protein